MFLAVCRSVLVWAALWGSDAPEEAIAVVVNTENPIQSLTQSELRELYFKKVTLWGNDTRVQPVTLGRDHPLRAQFAEAMLGKSLRAEISFWHQAIFSGRATPPVELGDEDAAIKYVQSNPGAIAYVSSVPESDGIRVLKIER